MEDVYTYGTRKLFSKGFHKILIEAPPGPPYFLMEAPPGPRTFYILGPPRPPHQKIVQGGPEGGHGGAYPQKIRNGNPG